MKPATTGPIAATIGAVTSHPTSPPPPDMAADPSLGVDAPRARCHRPMIERSRAPVPMTHRPVDLRSSGCRSVRQASAKKVSGMIHSSAPTSATPAFDVH